MLHTTVGQKQVYRYYYFTYWIQWKLKCCCHIWQRVPMFMVMWFEEYVQMHSCGTSTS